MPTLNGNGSAGHTTTTTTGEPLYISGVDLDVDAVLESFHRDGYVAIPNLLSPEELEAFREAAESEIACILEADPEREGNRNVGMGGHRYSFGSVQQFPRE
eukprot:scaffold380929_cov50-Prasinocladus_malaysianus.AAC.1